MQPPGPGAPGGHPIQPPPPQHQLPSPPVQQGVQSVPLVCPRCNAVATPQPGPQTCKGCRGRFSLYLGAAMDPSLQLPPRSPGQVKVKAAGVVSYRLGVVEAEGVAVGETDPVIGMIPMEKSGVAHHDILTISVWRKIDVLALVVALLVPVPLALLGIVALSSSVGGLFLLVPFGLLGGWMLYGALGVQRNFAQIAGRYRTIQIRFDKPAWRRRRFHDELLRRAGLPPAEIP